MIQYVGLFERLLKCGWSTYRLQKERVIGSGTITRIKRGLSISTDTIDTVCRLCGCQPGDVLRWVPDRKAGE